MTLRPDKERYKLSFALAYEMIEKLGLDYYKENKENINMKDVVNVIAKHHCLGPPIPRDIAKSPWLLSVNHYKDRTINWLLNQSMRVQSGMIKDTEFFPSIVTSDSLLIAGFMHFYLKEIGIKAQFVVGLMTFEPTPESNATAHVWLTIHDQLIDNMYMFVPAASKRFHLISSEKALLYKHEDPEKTSRTLIMCKPYSTMDRIKLFKVYATEAQVEKYLVTMLGMVRVRPTVRMYDVIMRQYIRCKLKLTLTDLEAKWRERCWHCETTKADLKVCPNCQQARYCSTECQANDWNNHKLLHREVKEFTASIIQEDEMNPIWWSRFLDPIAFLWLI